VAFTVPLDALLELGSLGDGLLLTVAAILGKFISGVRPPGRWTGRPSIALAHA
jgi:hypothetical protein